MAKTLNINQFNEAVNSFKRGFSNEMVRINRVIALSAIDMITERIVEKGTIGENKSLGKYSERPMSPGYFIGRGLGSGADKKVANYVKQQQKSGGVPGISYKKFRELNGLPTNHVTLSFTGETLNDLGILEQNSSNGIAKTSVGSKNSKSKDVVDKKGRKIGNIGTAEVLDNLNEKYDKALDTELLELSRAEEKILTEAAEVELQEYINSKFGD